MRDKEMAYKAHRHAAKKTTEVLTQELGNFLRDTREDPNILLHLCGSDNHHNGVLSTPSGLHIPLSFQVKYGDPISEKEYQKLAKSVARTGPLVGYARKVD